MDASKVAVILPTYRQPAVLLLTLRDLSVQDYPVDAWEVVVIDDGSRDHSAEIAMMSLPQNLNVTVKRLAHGGIYTHGKLFNELIRLADPRAQVFVHVEDARIRPDFLRQHVKWHHTNSEYLVTGPLCESTQETYEPASCRRWTRMQMSGVIAQAYHCCFLSIWAKSMSYSRELLRRLTDHENQEPFDSSMTGWGVHETEFAFRASNVGAICVYDVACAVYHPPHSARDEAGYRHFDRQRRLSEDSDKNIAYFCEKHHLAKLPDWMVGEPIAVPSGV